MDTIKASLQDARGGHHSQGKQDHQPTTEHLERQHVSSTQNNTTKTARKALPTGRPAGAESEDDAPPAEEQSETDHSSAKPLFTRGISVFDQTAITSAAPTPAGEISNPMSFGVGKSVSRQRESHLPDLELLQKVRAMSTAQKAQVAIPDPEPEPELEDDFGEDLSRQETEKGR